MENLFSLSLNSFNNNYFVFLVNIVAFVAKAFIFVPLLLQKYNTVKKEHPSLFLLFTLISSAFIDFGWIFYFSSEWGNLGYNFIPKSLSLFVGRLGWVFFILQYHGMVSLLNMLIYKDYKRVLYKRPFFLFFSGLFVLFFAVFPFITWNIYQPPFEHLMKHICSIYLLIFFIPIHLWDIYKSLQTEQLPIIIRKQCHVLLFALVIPYFLSDLMNMAPIRANYFAPLIGNQAFVGFSTLILTYLLYFCTRRILNIQLLSGRRRTEYPFISQKFHTHVKEMIEGLQNVSDVRNIAPLVERLLTKALRAPLHTIHLFVKDRVLQEHAPAHSWILLKKEILHPKVYAIETELAQDKPLLEYLKKEKCILYDELEYQDFYAHNPIATRALALLKPLNMVVFIPIFHKEQPVAYLVIERDMHDLHLYDTAERNLLTMVTTHLSVLITMLHKDETELVKSKLRTVSDELHHKHRQLIHIKESIRTFLNASDKQKIGYFFYKDKQFTPANKHATELMVLNLNENPLHPLTRTCTQLVRVAIDKEVVQYDHIKEIDGTKKLFAIAVPVPYAKERKEGILMVMSAHPADIVAHQITTADRMSDWDYLLYLETTKNGALVNTLLPGNSPYLMQTKINFLKSIIGTRATFLECHHKDISTIVALLHEMNGRQELITVDLNDAKAEDNDIKLFGIHSLYGTQIDTPLMSAAHRGTLCIKNAHLLSPLSQEYMVTYLHQGHFSRLKSNTRIDSDVHLVFTSPFHFKTHPAQPYSAPFIALAERSLLSVPSPLLLEVRDLTEVIDGYMLQILHESRSLRATTLSMHDRERLIHHNRPASLTELKERIYNILASKRTHIAPAQSPDTFFTSGIADADLTLETAQRMGRSALKDRRMMTFLWRKFEKKQSTIATFLGADRPAVCRSVKKFNLE